MEYVKNLTRRLNQVRTRALYAVRRLFCMTRIAQVDGLSLTLCDTIALDSKVKRVQLDPDLLLLERILLAVQRDGTGLDVGANAGVWTLYLARRCDHVVAFEPDPYVALRLKKNLELNPHVATKVTMSPLAVSDKRQTQKLYVRRSIDNSGRLNNGLSSLVRPSTLVQETVTVSTISIDEFVSEENLGISWIKIDVEGNEYAVLAGCRRTMEIFRPCVVWEMLFDRRSDVSAQVSRILNLFPEGYQHLVPVQSELIPLSEVDCTKLPDTNIFSLPHEILNKWGPPKRTIE